MAKRRIKKPVRKKKSDYPGEMSFRKALGMNPTYYQDGGNLNFQNGGEFENFVNTLPDNLRSSDSNYNLRGMWEASGSPKSFLDVKDTEYFPLQEDGTYHGFSVGNDGIWLKPKSHPSAWMEAMYGYQLNPEVYNNYNVTYNPEGYFGENQLQYVPKKKFGGKLYYQEDIGKLPTLYVDPNDPGDLLAKASIQTNNNFKKTFPRNISKSPSITTASNPVQNNYKQYENRVRLITPKHEYHMTPGQYSNLLPTDSIPQQGNFLYRTNRQNGGKLYYQENTGDLPTTKYGTPEYEEAYRTGNLLVNGVKPLPEFKVTPEYKSLSDELRRAAIIGTKEAAELTGVPGAVRFVKNPAQGLKGLGNTIVDLGLTAGAGLSPVGRFGQMNPMGGAQYAKQGTNPLTGEGSFRAEDVEGAFNTLDAAGIATIAGVGLKTPVQQGLKQTGKYLTQGPLRNAYNVLPEGAFSGYSKLRNANKSYRVAGMDAYDDFVESGVLRSRIPMLKPGMSFAQKMQQRPTAFPSFQKGYADLTYLPEEGGVVFETSLPTFKRGQINPVTGQPIKGRHYAHRVINPQTGATMGSIPGENISVYGSQPHWLKGYPQINTPKQLLGSPNALIGNNGMFDMTNPNMYKTLAPVMGIRAGAYGVNQMQDAQPTMRRFGGKLKYARGGSLTSAQDTAQAANLNKDVMRKDIKKASVGEDFMAGLYGVGEGLLDTVTFGLTDELTDAGFKALQAGAGHDVNSDEAKRQAGIKGWGNVGGAVTGAIINPASAFSAGQEGLEGIGQGIQGINPSNQSLQAVGKGVEGLGNIQLPKGMESMEGMSKLFMARNGGRFRYGYRGGGQMLNQNMGLTEIDGPSHEQGGVTLPNSGGRPDVEVEGPETIYTPENYVMSEKMKASKEALEYAGIIGKAASRLAGKSYADLSKSIKSKAGDKLRPADPLSKKMLDKEMKRLMMAHEYDREAKKIKDEAMRSQMMGGSNVVAETPEERAGGYNMYPNAESIAFPGNGATSVVPTNNNDPIMVTGADGNQQMLTDEPIETEAPFIEEKMAQGGLWNVESEWEIIT